MNRVKYISLCLFLAATFFPTNLAWARSAAQKPNIVFFLTDDQRFDVMGCAGHQFVKTPTMDRLAKLGVRFKNAFVTTSICAASRASILTSLYERTHQYTFGEQPVREEHMEKSYPLLLRQAGYRTGFIGKFGVGVTKGMPQKMFDVYRPLNRSPYFKKQKDGSKRFVEDIAGDYAIEFLRSCKKDQPFCLSISFNAPHAEDGDKKDHYPYPDSVADYYKNDTIPPPRLSDPKIFESQPKVLQESMNRDRYFWRWDTPEKYQKNVKSYFRMISAVDLVMGRVIDELKKLDLEENTVIIFCGDNGYYLANRGFAGKWSHYEDSLRIPMIIYDPRMPAEHRGKVVDAMVLNIDVPATMIDLAGLPIPKLYQGRSLVPFLKGESPPDWRTETFCEHLMRNARIPKWEGVRGSRYVYARYFDQNPPFEFLHDLKTDPDQLKNFANDPNYTKILREMRQRTNELRDRVGGPYNPRPKPGKKQPAKKNQKKQMAVWFRNGKKHMQLNVAHTRVLSVLHAGPQTIND